MASFPLGQFSTLIKSRQEVLYCSEENHRFESHNFCTKISAPSLMSSMSLEKSPSISLPQSPHL